KMNAPDSGLTIENRAPNASSNVVNATPMARPPRPRRYPSISGKRAQERIILQSVRSGLRAMDVKPGILPLRMVFGRRRRGSHVLGDMEHSGTDVQRSDRHRGQRECAVVALDR